MQLVCLIFIQCTLKDILCNANHQIDPSRLFAYTLSVCFNNNSTLFKVKNAISQQNIQALQQLNGSDILLEVCANLVHLKRYQLYYSDAVQRGEFTLPSTLADAVNTRSSVQQVKSALPLLLDSGRIRSSFSYITRYSSKKIPMMFLYCFCN